MRRIPQLIFVIISLIYASESFAEKPFNFNESLNEFLKEAPGLKDSAVQKAADPKYDPRTKIDGYTEQPKKEISYYHEEGSDSAGMEIDAATAVKPGLEGSPNGNTGQAVIHSFKKRPVYKLTWNDPDIQSAKNVEDHPEKHVKLDINSKTNCEKKKTTNCKETFNDKTCTEQVKALVKVCEKVPKIATSSREIAYPNCQQLIITQHVRSYCPAGYGEMFSADMVQTFDDHWDDIRFCARALPAGEGAECFSGAYYVTSNRGSRDAGRVTVPKKLHARIGMSNVYYGFIIGTIINETTGETIHSNAQFSNGQVINLPYSETQDQTFRFYAVQPQSGVSGGRFFRRLPEHRPGVMVLYVEHTKREAVANFEGWQEADCHEI